MANKEIKKSKRKLRWQIKLILIITLIILYAFFIGTKGIFIKDYVIKTNKIDNSMHGLKILQFSDIHYGSSVNDKMILQLVNKINDAKPDIVIFTGDLIDERHKLKDEEKKYLIKNLSKIEADLGKYYITGEEDFKDATSILDLADFINLDSKNQQVYLNSKIPIELIGKQIDESYFNDNDKTPYFKLLILHNPDDIKKYKKYNIDIAIAGHTHNGGINIPKLKDILISSDYKKTYQKVNKIKFYINPGIGTSNINVRLFNHPTIYLYRLNKTSK